MKILRAISRFLNSILGYVTFIAFFTIMTFIVVNVVMRYIFNSPVLGAYEIVEEMMFVGVFCSFAYAHEKGAHIRVSMLLLHLHTKISMLLCSLMGILGTITLVLLTYSSYKQDVMAIKYSYTTAQLKITLVPFYTIQIICCAIFTLAVALDTIDYIRGIFNDELAKQLVKKI